MSILGKKDLTTTQMIALGFLVAIIIGSLLLMLPISSRSGNWTSYLDALFMATTSICVTGLTTVNTLEHWSIFGEIVILILIQFGGLGIVTFSTATLLIVGKRITLKERLLIQDSYNLDRLGGLVKLTIRIIKGTIIVEGIGAVLFSFQFIPEFGFAMGIWKSIFHSISAFCNAGIDIIGDASFMPYRGNLLINTTTMMLIIAGGLGFPVWWDLMNARSKIIKKKLRKNMFFKKLPLHSKLVLTITAVLIISGTLIILLLEFNNPKTLGELPWWEKIMASLFQSVTTRTAGFLTIPQENFTNATSFFCIVLMFIGGSPSGTAGGVKTVTVAMMILAVVSILKDKDDVEVFHRKITNANVRKGLAVVLISLGVLILSVMLLSIVENGMFLDVFYETASALGTVGLSRNYTGKLSIMGKIIIIVVMYVGRIGPITMALFFNRKNLKGNKTKLPEGKIIVG